MHRIFLLLLLAAGGAWAQDAEQQDDRAPADPVENAADADEDAADELDDLVELYPVEDEDEFIPSENVKFGQSIPFPTDI